MDKLVLERQPTRRSALASVATKQEVLMEQTWRTESGSSAVEEMRVGGLTVYEYLYITFIFNE